MLDLELEQIYVWFCNVKLKERVYMGNPMMFRLAKM